MVAAAAAGILTLTAGSFWIFRRQQHERKRQKELFPGIPSAPGAHWLLGHMIV